VRIFLWKGGELPAELRAAIVSRLFTLGVDRVAYGRWKYLRGNEFEKVCLGIDERAGPA
jgi:hypothetical protein